MNTLAPAPSADDLNDAERQLLHAAATGQLVDLSSGDADLDNPARASEWPDSRVIRAEVIADLLTGDRDPDGTKLRAVKLRGARITGPLDLEARTLLCPLLLQDCSFAETPNLSDATAVTIRLPGCHLPGLNAEQLRTSGDLELNTGFTASGEVTLLGAHVGGQLDLSGAALTNEGGDALTADGLTVDQDMFCQEGFTAHGGIRLLGAHIGSQLNLSGATLVNEHGCALDATEVTIDRDMICDESFSARGEIRLFATHIGGQVVLTGATLTNEGGHALNADALTVGHDLFGDDGFTVHGEMRLRSAHIGGQLILSRGTLINENAEALSAAGITVKGDMFCDEGFTARGAISLVGAHVNRLDLRGATLANHVGGAALDADGLTVNRDMNCSEGFSTRGAISMDGARIGGSFYLAGATLVNESGSALSADMLTVGQAMFCARGFTAHGEISLADAHVGELFLHGATLANPGGTALSANGLTVDRAFSCADGFTAHGEICISRAHIGELVLRDTNLSNPNGNALTADELTVNGIMLCDEGFRAQGTMLMYGANIQRDLCFEGALLTGEGDVLILADSVIGTLDLRLKRAPDGAINLSNAKVGRYYDDPATWASEIWLRGFEYDVLENDTIRVGKRVCWLARHPEGSVPQIYDQLATAYRRSGRERAARRVAITKQWRSRSRWNPLNWLLYATVGYGYRNWLAGIWLAALTAAGSVVFSHAHMTPLTAHPPAYHPVIYTLDVLLPIVDFGQQSAWQPHGAALDVSWFLISAGWVLTTAVVAGLAGVLQRDSPRL